MLLLITNVINRVIKLVINNIWPYMATYTYAYMAAYKWYCYCNMFEVFACLQVHVYVI